MRTVSLLKDMGLQEVIPPVAAGQNAMNCVFSSRESFILGYSQKAAPPARADKQSGL